MRNTSLSAIVALFLTSLFLGCPPPPKGAGGGGGGTAIAPDACGNISVSKIGRKLHSFLVASAELDRASTELERSVGDACRKMARELEVSADGTTKEVCDRAVAELNANLEISVSQETQLVTRYKPAECTTEIDFAASIVAECEASVAADVQVRCDGYCGGSCSGACDGTCAGSTGSGGECNGTCEGTCRGRCSADCRGSVDVDASVECKASAEVRASVNTTCTEPEVEVVEQEVTIIDATKFNRAMAAIKVGLPTLLRVGAKAALVAKAVVQWGKTLGGLIKSSGQLVGELGEKGLCVAGQLTAAFGAVAQVEARVSVSVEVSASVSASAGGQAQ